MTMNGQTILKGDMNDDGNISITDAVSIVNVILGERAQETINIGCSNGCLGNDPYKVDNTLVVGSWNLTNGTTLTLNEDGTTNYGTGYTYKFRPGHGTLLIFDASGNPVKTLVLNEVDDTYMLAIDYNTGLYTKYTKVTEQDGNHQYVDLGLPSGTLWATCNLGAEKPEEAGDYYAWGETVPYGQVDESNAQNYKQTGSYTKEKYDWNTYKWCNGSSSTLTKYNSTDSKAELDPEDDAAYVNWGSSWRIPTIAQLEELMNTKYTKITTVTRNGVSGRKITSLTNGNSIFIPCLGYRYAGCHSDFSGSNCWSRNLQSGLPQYAQYFIFRTDTQDAKSHTARYYGYSIRPVRTTQ